MKDANELKNDVDEIYHLCAKKGYTLEDFNHLITKLKMKQNDYIDKGNKEILRRHLEENTYDNTFLVMPDDEEKSMIITPSISGTTLKLSIKRAELLAKIIQDQIQEWK